MGRKAAVAEAIDAIESSGGRHLSSPESSTLTSRKRRRKRRKKSTDSPENPSAPAGSVRHIDPSMAKEILVLFETPSGFAIFCLKYDLNEPDVMEKIWAIFVKDYRSRKYVCLKEFQAFKDKSSAFNHGTGVSNELTEMILRHHRPGQTLAVGKPEYKRLMETSLDVPCLLNETVMEVMWGLENLMPSLLPQEVKLMEYRLPMCKGIQILLNRYGFDVKPEMVNEEVLVTACRLVDAELLEKKNTEILRWVADQLKDVSGINTKDWDNLKIARALRIIFEPIFTTEADMKMFTPEEFTKLIRDADKYEDMIEDRIVLINSELVLTREAKRYAKEDLVILLS